MVSQGVYLPVRWRDAGVVERERRYPSDRTVVDAILYVVRSGCSWRQPPVDLPPWQTVYWQVQQREQRQVTERIREELREQVRVAEGRDREPSAGVMDSQSVKAADTVSRDFRGWDLAVLFSA